MIRKIQHLTHDTIDFEKWDQCIYEAYNGLPYALSWYLNIVSPNWEALVADDYNYVLPIPIKRKFKLAYIVQPMLTQQLGVFAYKPVTPEILRLFIQKLPSYSYELNFNTYNKIDGAKVMPNYLLDMSPEFTELKNGFSKNTRRNIEKAEKLGHKIIQPLAIDQFLHFYESIDKNYISVGTYMLQQLIKAGSKRDVINICGVKNTENELIAALCCIHFKNRITCLLPISNEAGKSASAMFLLINYIIRNHAGKPYILDFEGSAIDGIARFYKGFGAVNQPYYILKKLRPSFLVGKI